MRENGSDYMRNGTGRKVGVQLVLSPVATVMCKRYHLSIPYGGNSVTTCPFVLIESDPTCGEKYRNYGEITVITKLRLQSVLVPAHACHMSQWARRSRRCASVRPNLAALQRERGGGMMCLAHAVVSVEFDLDFTQTHSHAQLHTHTFTCTIQLQPHIPPTDRCVHYHTSCHPWYCQRRPPLVPLVTVTSALHLMNFVQLLLGIEGSGCPRQQPRMPKTEDVGRGHGQKHEHMHFTYMCIRAYMFL